MGEENNYGKIIENFVDRNINVGDRVKSYFKKEWFNGEVVKKYFKDSSEVPYVLVKTDLKVDNDPEAYLKGFGLEGKVDWHIIFEDEPNEGNEINNKIVYRNPTPEEKEFYDNLPF